MIDVGMDAGNYTFVMAIPPDFQRDVLAGKSPAIQLNVDATRMSQAFVGSSYIQQMTMDEVREFTQRRKATTPAMIGLALRARFNPNLEQAWFGSLMEIINNVTMLVNNSDRRCVDPRTRTRHDRALVGHAGDSGGDHAGKSLVNGSCRATRRRAIAGLRSAGIAESPDRRFSELVPCWNRRCISSRRLHWGSSWRLRRIPCLSLVFLQCW